MKYEVLLRRSVIEEIIVKVESQGRVAAGKLAVELAKNNPSWVWKNTGTPDTQPYSVSETKIEGAPQRRGKPYFIMLVGIPGSGKSRWASQVQSLNTQIVCPDQIRKDIGENVSDQSVNILAWEKALKETLSLLKLKKNVILDATNVNAREWEEFVSKLPPCKKVAKLFEVSPEIAYGRIVKDAERKEDRCHVPEHAVYRYYGMYLHTKKVLKEFLKVRSYSKKGKPDFDDFDVTVIKEPEDWVLDVRESQKKFGGQVMFFIKN
jgi:predicted kinase